MIILTPAELEALKEGWGEITFDEDGYGSLADGTVICGPANEHECADYDTLAPKMTRYNHDIMASEQPWWPAIKGITVADEECKKQLLAALKYLHNNYTIDTEFMVVNALLHMYQQPDLITVAPKPLRIPT